VRRRRSRIAPKSLEADGENEGVRQRASELVTDKAGLNGGRGRHDFSLRWSGPKHDFELNGSCPCWPNVLGPRPKRDTSHMLARARHRPCFARSLWVVPIDYQNGGLAWHGPFGPFNSRAARH
jgi:hypothetical protein